MKFNTIRIKNFLGIKEYEATLMGMSAKLSARNGKGKTTFKNAITWCLFEKDHMGRQLDPKPRVQDNDGSLGERIRGLIPEVELVVELETGETVTLLRRLEEDINKKGEYISDLGYWEVDGLECNMTEYNAHIDRMIGDVEIFKVMLNPDVFLCNDGKTISQKNSKIKLSRWEYRRKFLEKMVGQTKPEDIFDGSEIDILNGRTIDEAYNIAKAALKKQEKKQEDMIPTMKEAVKRLNQSNPITKSKEELKEELDKIVADRKQEEENCKNPDFSKRAELASKIHKLETEAKEAYTQTLKGYDNTLDDIDKRMGNLRIESLEKTIERKKTQLVTEKETLRDMVEKFKEFDKEEFNDTECITCGQTLPEYLREQYQQKFNETHAETRKQLLARGKSQKLEVKELEKEIAELETNLKTMQEEYKLLKESYTKLIDEKQNTAYTEPPEIEKLRSERNLLSESGEFKKSERLTELEGKEELIREQIAEYNSTIANQKRVKELEKEEEELGDIVTECKRVRDLTLELKRRWSHEIEKKANKMFSLIKWRMSEEQKNGEPKDICEAMYNGIDYNKTVSNGEGVNICLDLHNTVSRFFGIKFPAIIDNAESITDWLVKPENQTIFLYAKEDINKLEMEIMK